MSSKHVQPVVEFEQQYDCVIAALGYERRSRFVCEHLAPKAVLRECCGFTNDQVLSFAANNNWFRDAGYQVQIVDNDGFVEWADGVLKKALAIGKTRLRLLIDISSQSRFRIAALLDAIMSIGSDVECDVDFAYALAAFSDPPREASPIETAGPVLDRFAGWSAEPELPLSIVVGAGYEPDKVLGVIEYLEPGEVWVWVPHGKDERFLSAISRSNEGLWESIPDGHRINYEVLNPYLTFVRLESLCYGLSRRSRPVLIPFGPKMFALIAMLVALHWPEELAVWRVSGEFAETPVDCCAEGTIVGLRVLFSNAYIEGHALRGNVVQA